MKITGVNAKAKLVSIASLGTNVLAYNQKKTVAKALKKAVRALKATGPKFHSSE
jgi:hypothetical protein